MCIKFSFPGFLTLILWGLSNVVDNEYWLPTVYLKQRRISLMHSFCALLLWLCIVCIDWILGKGGQGF